MFFRVLVIIALILGIAVAAFDQKYAGKVFPNVTVAGISFGDSSRAQVADYWLEQNKPFASTKFELHYDSKIATISSQDLDLGYDATLSATQAYLVGRSRYWLSNLYHKFLRQTVNLTPYYRWDTQVVEDKLAAIADTVDIPAQDALFQFENGKVTSFRPSAPGRSLNKDIARQRIEEALNNAKSGLKKFSILLPIEVVSPKVTTDSVNSFGIKTRVARGYSEFAGSLPGRVHNVALAASRINGILIKPGEIFSFNDAVGDITAATGYQSAYIIKDGHTVLGDGGGVCQVSTTLFRAALDAGLPIVERHAHDYRVHYYEEGGFKPGIDATVYGPTFDLKFKNDTPGYLLIQTKIDYNKPSLTFELYGTSDGRSSLVSNFKLWGITPPPPTLYQDDPTLAKGAMKQVDFEAWGAKTSFDYRVTRAGSVLQDTSFLSDFRPWQAVYLRGTM